MVEGISPQLIMKLTFLLLMIAVAVIDWDRMIIPDLLTIAGLLLGVAFHIAGGVQTVPHALLAGAGAFGMLIFIRSAGSWFLGKEAMGVGDLKLAAVVAFFLGFQGFLVALWGAAGTGAIHGLISKSRIRRLHGGAGRGGDETRVPFGSHLALCSALVMVFEEHL